MIHASEDVGLADPTALPAATAAAQVVQLVGMPEARIALAQVTVHLATAPKSNAVITAIDAAMADVRSGKVGGVPHTCATAITPARRSWATPSATATRTTTPTASCASSTRPTTSSASTTTRRPGVGTNASWPSACRSCGVSCAVPGTEPGSAGAQGQPERSGRGADRGEVAGAVAVAAGTGVHALGLPGRGDVGAPESPSWAHAATEVSPDWLWPSKFTVMSVRWIVPQDRPLVEP